jgi:hypothetical protein
MFDQRANRRFPLRLPFKVVRNTLEFEGETHNLSSRGVAFTITAKLEVGEPIEYVITLLGDDRSGSAVRLRCTGKTLRNDQSACAATLERYEFVREHA